MKKLLLASVLLTTPALALEEWAVVDVSSKVINIIVVNDVYLAIKDVKKNLIKTPYDPITNPGGKVGIGQVFDGTKFVDPIGQVVPVDAIATATTTAKGVVK